MSILASRGAELLEELHQKRIEIQENVEKTVLEKLKFKMDKIKANQQRIQGPSYRGPQTHKIGKIIIENALIILKTLEYNILITYKNTHTHIRIYATYISVSFKIYHAPIMPRVTNMTSNVSILNASKKRDKRRWQDLR